MAMAEIISKLCSFIFDKLASEAFKKIALFKRIDPDLEKLKMSLIRINDLLNDASQKEIRQEAVREWLKSLQHLAYDIDDLLDELATDAMHREFTEESGTPSKVRKLMPSISTNFSESARMHNKLENITTKLQELLEGEGQSRLGLSVIEKSPKHRTRRLETSLVDASSIVGRTDDKDKLLLKLFEPCDRNFSIVPIVGMGGVGKTTLARLLYDEVQVKDHFQLMAWVCVSDEFDIFNISKTIFQSIGGENQEFSDLNLLQVALREKISNKRFLLVLDDVWSENYTYWETLAGPFLAGAPGSKVIITTRKLSLLTQLGCVEPYALSVLSHVSALSLFCQHALGANDFISHATLKAYGEGIVRKCDGLPLALKALGRLLRSKTDEEDWKDVLNSEIWSLGKKDEIVPALRLSYHDLTASLKQLFSYSCLFPKDYVFNKEELILLWMAEGFLGQSSTSKSMERVGLECFEELLSRSFFQHAPNDKSLFVMHDLMNDLATSVAGDFFTRSDIKMKKELRKEALGKCRHFSFVCEKFNAYKRLEVLEGAKTLRTCLALSPGGSTSSSKFYLPHRSLHNLIQDLPLLRVLSFSQLEISEVPESIGGLKHLRYLNFSRTKICELPETVGNLYNLQTLIVFGCRELKVLPNSFSKLENLRHFDWRATPLLKKMPLGIGELKSLRTLSKIMIEGDNGFSITKLKDLKDLQGTLVLTGLEKVQSPMEAYEANISQKRLSELVLIWDNVFDGSQKETVEKEVLNVLKPGNDHLKILEIAWYGGREFPNWVGDPSFLQLTKVVISGCKKCTSLPPLGQLPALKGLLIQGMDEVKVVGLEFLGTATPSFPSLVSVTFRDMKGWEVWSTSNSNAAFPCLQGLGLVNCPNLVEVSVEELPSLRLLEIESCGHAVLTSLVHVASSVTRLEISSISGLTDELWRGVIEYLGKVEWVTIKQCNEIRYMWESETEASKVLVNLRHLEVFGCSKLVRLGEKEEDDCGTNLTSLRWLKVDDCNSLEHCRCPDNIESLIIKNCEKLLEKELEGGGEKSKLLINSSMSMLDYLYIKSWPNLKRITELSCFIHLTRLLIWKCPGMESFPDDELPNLTSLTRLQIRNCTSMDASFPRGFWPPKLSYLNIGRLKKPISEWGQQNFPTSLAQLVLLGGPSDDVRNIGQLSHLLPPSLTSLSIDGFKKLESVSTGLQHLTSLQHLWIYNCPKTKDLPEKLLPSLLKLRINECPKLEEKSRKGGSYWPLVSLIPCVLFNYEIPDII